MAHAGAETDRHEVASGGGGGGRSVVTLSPAAAAAVRRLGEQMGGNVTAAAVVRRGLVLLDLYLGLKTDEELVVRNTERDQIERLRFAWETF